MTNTNFKSISVNMKELTPFLGFLFLKDISLSGSEPEPYTSMMDYMHGKEGNTVMVNGLVNPVLNIQPGQSSAGE